MTPLDGEGPGQVDLHALVALAESVARLAGHLVVDERPDRVAVASTKSSPTDIVTIMDTASEALLRKAIHDARPDDGILGEEGGQAQGSSGLTWVLDPIDGTVNYLYGIPAYAISVAVVTGDPLDPGGHQVLAGCVHHPLSKETWTATRGGGAFLDGRPVRANSDVPLNRALVATGFGYDAERRRHAARVVAEVLPQVRDIRRIGSAALDLAAVACGRLDAYYERGLGAWDLAAGGLIAREAGAQVGGLLGRPAGPELVVAAGPGLYERLQDLLAPLRPDRDGGADEPAQAPHD